MATDKNITMKQFNGTDYDTLYPETTASQVDGVVAYNVAQSLTTAQQSQARTNIDAAPGGYGFGANAKRLTASDNIDTLVASGIYQWGGQ